MKLGNLGQLAGTLGQVGNYFSGMAEEMQAKRIAISSARIQSDYLDMSNNYLREMQFSDKGLDESMREFQDRQTLFMDTAFGDDADLRLAVEPKLLSFRQEQMNKVYEFKYNSDLATLKPKAMSALYTLAEGYAKDPSYASMDEGQIISLVNKHIDEIDLAGDAKLNIFTTQERQTMLSDMLSSMDATRIKNAVAQGKTYQEKIELGTNALNTSRFLARNPEQFKQAAAGIATLNDDWKKQSQTDLDGIVKGYLQQEHAFREARTGNVLDLEGYFKKSVDSLPNGIHPEAIGDLNTAYKGLEVISDKENQAIGPVSKALFEALNTEVYKRRFEGEKNIVATVYDVGKKYNLDLNDPAYAEVLGKLIRGNASVDSVIESDYKGIQSYLKAKGISEGEIDTVSAQVAGIITQGANGRNPQYFDNNNVLKVSEVNRLTDNLVTERTNNYMKNAYSNGLLWGGNGVDAGEKEGFYSRVMQGKITGLVNPSDPNDPGMRTVKAVNQFVLGDLQKKGLRINPETVGNDFYTAKREGSMIVDIQTQAGVQKPFRVITDESGKEYFFEPMERIGKNVRSIPNAPLKVVSDFTPNVRSPARVPVTAPAQRFPVDRRGVQIQPTPPTPPPNLSADKKTLPTFNPAVRR